MTREEAVALTLAMRDSGTVLDWSDLDGPVLDKHSTGGIGDNVSLMLAPALAACGAYVPMISGRGLGHTGGTLDKLDSVPGYTTQPDNELFRKVVRDVGCAVIGQTADLAPADKRLYGIRDVTATVESIPLITASILSKKLAAGLAGLVMDVKTGNGAFMATMDASRGLARSLVEVANGAGLATSALITDMNEPLASAAGNAVEVLNAVEFLTGTHVDRRLWEVTAALGGELLVTGGLAKDAAEGRAKIEDAFRSGAAAEKFDRMTAALGGPADFVRRPAHYLPAAPVVRDVAAEGEGTVAAIDTRAVGIAVVELGGGRMRASDTIDHAVGFTALAGLGAAIGKGAPLGRVHARDAAAADRAVASLRAAYRLGGSAPPSHTIYERIGA
jgi:thymidine phosphorylase